MKVTIIGGGSTYSPELVEGLILRHKEIDLNEVVLMDIDAARLKVVGDFAIRMVAHAGAPFAIRYTTDRVDALKGADFVLTQIRVGQNPARHKDILLGLRHDLIGQETTGVGGFAKAMRTIPAITDIARDMLIHAPNAFMINFTNPSGLITEALHKFGVKRLVGLCNVPIGLQMDIAKHLDVERERVRLDYVGLNHLAWVRKVWFDGADITTLIIKELTGKAKPANIPDMEYAPEFLKALGFLPNPYLRYFYLTQKMLAELKAAPKTRAEEVAEIERDLLAQYADPTVVTKPEELEKRGGAFYSKIAIDLIEAIWKDTHSVHVVNLPNQGAVDGIGYDQTVEIPAVITKNGAKPIVVGQVEPKIAGLMQQVKAYESLAVQAGLDGSYDAALLALSTHPLCGAEKAKAVLDDIIETFGLTYLK